MKKKLRTASRKQNLLILIKKECILVKNETPACSYLSTSRYKNTNHTLHISIELLLMFLIQKSLSSQLN